MTKAIIFDCFGVLVESSVDVFFEKYLSDTPDKIERLRGLDDQASRGRLTYDEFVVEAAQIAGISTKETRGVLDTNPSNIPLLEFIRDELKPHYKIGFLSNASDDWLEELFSPDQQSLFDDFVLSFQHGIAKPDTAIFELAAERLGTKPVDCVFVDDVTAYCEGARSVGMQTIQFQNFEQFKKELQGVL